MKFDLDLALETLSRTPQVLQHLLRDHPNEWTKSNAGPETWSPFDVLGHLIHGERTDWVPRARIILQAGTAQTFDPFDRFAQYEVSRGKTLNELLDIFAELRGQNITAIQGIDLSASDLALKGMHPELGEVTLQALLATWMAHDLSHIEQIVHVMAWQFAEATEPWRTHLFTAEE